MAQQRPLELFEPLVRELTAPILANPELEDLLAVGANRAQDAALQVEDVPRPIADVGGVAARAAA